MDWLLLIAEFIIGCALLAWSADRFIKGSVAIAKHYNVSSLVVGMVLIGFGTSCPEFIVSFFAAMKGSSGLAIGNVLGSNIANIALVGGVAALFAPLVIHSRVLFREFPFLIGVTLLVGLIFYGGMLGRIDGVILLLMFFVYLWWMFRMARQGKEAHDPLIEEMEHEVPPGTMSLRRATLWFVIGLVVLLGSAELIVDSAARISALLGLSDLIIGLTIVAIGTSLPELAATVMSCLRKEYDLAIGNVVGSCLFNLLAVLSVPALLDPGEINQAIMRRDYPVLLIITLLLR